MSERVSNENDQFDNRLPGWKVGFVAIAEVPLAWTESLLVTLS